MLQTALIRIIQKKYKTKIIELGYNYTAGDTPKFIYVLKTDNRGPVSIYNNTERILPRSMNNHDNERHGISLTMVIKKHNESYLVYPLLKYTQEKPSNYLRYRMVMNVYLDNSNS